MIRLSIAVAVFALVGTVQAEQAAGNWTPLPPRPGDETVVRVGRHGDETWVVLQPGREVTVSPPAGTRRLRVESSPVFAKRDAGEAKYAWDWQADQGKKTRVGFKTKPTKTATIRGRDGIPGAIDRKVIELKSGGATTLRIRLSPGTKFPVLLRFSTEAVPGPGTAAPHPKAKAGWRLGGEYRFQIAVDDNVFHWSQADRRRLDKGSSSDRFDHMNKPWDVILTDRADVWIGYGTKADSIAVGLNVTDRRFLENSVLSTDEVGLYAQLELWNKTEIRLYGWWRPENFTRNLDPIRIPGGGRQEAIYDEYGAGLRWNQEWARFLSTRLAYEWRENDYNSDFDERDLRVHRLRVGVRVDPIKYIYAELRYEFELAGSAASSGEPDISYRQHAPRLEIGTRIGGFFASLSWLYERRQYTTSNTDVEDPAHADRVDQRNRWEIGAGYKFDLGKSVELELKLSYARDQRRVSIPGSLTTPSGTPVDDTFDYDADIVELGATLRF